MNRELGVPWAGLTKRFLHYNSLHQLLLYSSFHFRLTLVKTINQRMDMDGLNSLKYHLSEIVEKQLYTLIRVEVKKHEYVYPTFTKDDPHWQSYGSFVTK